MNDAISLSGIQQTQKKIFGFSDKLGDRITKLALRSGANYMLKRIRLAAPKDTGNLRRAIVVKNSRKNQRRINGRVGVYITINKGKRKRHDGFYGRFLEMGYRSGRRRIPGLFFIRNTYNQSKDQSARLIIRNIETAGKRLAKSL